MLPLDEGSQFFWTSFDVRAMLPDDYHAQVRNAVKSCSVKRVLTPTSVTSRESRNVSEIPVSTVSGESIRDKLPWLWSLYHNEFLQLAEQICRESVLVASRDRIKVNLNVQSGREMRYECHIDSNPIEALLYLTTHRKGEGGELVVSNASSAKSIEDVEKNHSEIYPIAGQLVFFDGRVHPHYVRALTSNDATRIVAAMNYYTPSWGEKKRPSDLDFHLFGETQGELK